LKPLGTNKEQRGRLKKLEKFTKEFENLANKILEKSNKFTNKIKRI
jgi:hypothetical protein